MPPSAVPLELLQDQPLLDHRQHAMPPSPPPSSFRLLRTAAAAADSGARLGLLTLPGARGPPLPTPALIAVTSRGALPHVTPDNATRHGLFAAAYLALEDFVEKVPLQPDRTPPILATPPLPATSPLHTFTALPTAALSVLAPRRHPAAAAHLASGSDHISVVTSTGVQRLTVHDYRHAVDLLQPDIAIPMADLTYGGGANTHVSVSDAAGVLYPTAKRAARMAERTEDWVDTFLETSPQGSQDSQDPQDSQGFQGPQIFAPTLPVPYAMQWQYLNRLAELMDTADGKTAPLAGLAVYDVDLLPDLHADYAASLAPLPRLSLHPAPTPHHVLRQIALGVDLLVLPAITAASEGGLAYTFAWEDSDSSSSDTPRPLAIDLADPQYKASLDLLAPGCDCAACTAGHHRAYLHHLLDAREMLVWTLLQMHNHHVVSRLLAGVRATLAAPNGPEAFEAARRRFHAAYTPEMPPARDSSRPRTRGYQAAASAGGVGGGSVEAPPLNKPAWGRLKERAGV